MSKISNKKRKFIKRNLKQLSLEELARQTDLKPQVIRSLIDEYTVEMPRKGQVSSRKMINSKSFLMRRSVQVIGASAIFLLIFIIYTPALDNEFINRDDGKYVYENKNIHSLNSQSFNWMLTSFHASNWHPLTWLSHAIDYAFWGPNPFGHHLSNVILHGLNTLLVFLLVIRLILRAREGSEIPLASKTSLSVSTKSLIVAGVTALLFGLHPLHVESVAWVAERKDLLCAAFVLLGMLSYLSYASSVVKRHQWIWFTACLLLFICALMSKPMAVTLPLILLLLDIYPLKRISFYPSKTGKDLSVLLEKIPFFALSIASSIITIMAQHSGETIVNLEQFPIDTRLLSAIRSLGFYLGKMIVPIRLVPFYPYPTHIHWLDIQHLLSGILVFGITGGCLWMARRKKYLFFITWSYYVVTLLPVIGIIQVGINPVADRYTYLPSLSIFLLVGIGVVWVFERVELTKYKGLFRGSLLAFICIVMFLLSQLTIKQIRIWQNSEIFWSYIISASPKNSFVPHYNLGQILAEKGRLDEAISAFKKTLTINPNFEPAHSSMGVLYGKQWRLDEAISAFNNALTIKPDLARVHNNLSFAYYLKGNYKLAIFHCDRATELGYRVNPELLESLKLYR